METRSTKMSLIKPTLIKPTQIRSALFSNLHFWCPHCLQGVPLTNQRRIDADDTEEASCGTLTWKIPSSTPQQEEGLPPGFPCAVSPAGLLYLLLGQASIVDSRFVLYLVSSAMFYPCIRLFCSLTAPLRGACKWYSASFKSKWESLTCVYKPWGGTSEMSRAWLVFGIGWSLTYK